MTLPTVQKTWVISPNNRITYVSLVDLTSRFLYGLKAFLKTNGYTVKGSCDGTTGSMDGTDRWASQANVVTRGAGSGNAQSWVVLTDGNACDILFTFQGASDDIARISFSPGGLFVAAGTANQQPTATDEQVFLSATSIVNSATSADRVWHAWVTSDKKMFRVAIARSAVVCAPIWGVEVLTSVAVSPAVFTPAVWGHAHSAGNLSAMTAWNTTYSANAKGGLARAVVSAVGINMTLGGYAVGYNFFGGGVAGVNTELQGSQGPLVQELGVGSATASARGPLGLVIDRWFSNDSQPDGTTTSAKGFILLTGSGSNGQGHLFPWDGTTTPQMS